MPAPSPKNDWSRRMREANDAARKRKPVPAPAPEKMAIALKAVANARPHAKSERVSNSERHEKWRKANPALHRERAHWPSNKHHSFVDKRCSGCGASPRTDGLHYPCGSYPITYHTPSGQITAGIPENGGYAVLEWPDSLTEATAQAALDDFIIEHLDEMNAAQDRLMDSVSEETRQRVMARVREIKDA